MDMAQRDHLFVTFIWAESVAKNDLGAGILIDFYTVLDPTRIVLISLASHACFIVTDDSVR